MQPVVVYDTNILLSGIGYRNSRRFSHTVSIEISVGYVNVDKKTCDNLAT